MTLTKSSDKFRLTVEPIMCTVFFIIGLSGPLTDLVMRQSCVALNRDPANCTSDEAVDVEVHRTASTFSMLRIIFDTLPGCIMTLFTGPWSNTNGRKPVLIIALLGLMLSQLVQAYLATITTIHPYWFLLACAPMVFTGGSISLILISVAYMIDITSNETRTFRLAILNWTSFLVAVLTNFAATSFKKIGYPEGYGIMSVIVMIVLIYTVFSLPESVVVDKEKRAKLFTTEHFMATCKSFFRQRPNHVRGIVWCLTVSSSIGLLVAVGENEVKYLSLIKKFGWDLSEYSTYNAFTQTVGAFAALAGVYIGSSILKMDEIVCILFSFVLSMASCIFTVLFAQPMAFWTVTQLKCFSGCLNPFVRGYISKLVPHDEVVNILSFMGSVEAFMPQIAALMYSNFYNWVVRYDAFAFYNLSSLLFGVCISFLIATLMLRRKAVRRENHEPKEDLESFDTVKHIPDTKEGTAM